MRRRLGPLAGGVDGLRAVHDVVADAVLREAAWSAGARTGAPRWSRSRRTAARASARRRGRSAESRGARPGPPGTPSRHGRAAAWARRPPTTRCCGTTASAARGARRVGGAVVRGDAAEDVLGRRLRVLDLDVEVAARVEDAGVEQLVLELLARALPVDGDQVVVRKLGLRILVQLSLVAVGRDVVDVEVVLLDVLAVVALGVGQAEQPLLEDRVAPVPQRERQAQPLLVVADPGDAVLAPPVGARARLIVGEVRPGVAARRCSPRGPFPTAVRSGTAPRRARAPPPVPRAAAAPRPSASLADQIRPRRTPSYPSPVG